MKALILLFLLGMVMVSGCIQKTPEEIPTCSEIGLLKTSVACELDGYCVEVCCYDENKNGVCDYEDKSNLDFYIIPEHEELKPGERFVEVANIHGNTSEKVTVYFATRVFPEYDWVFGSEGMEWVQGNNTRHVDFTFNIPEEPEKDTYEFTFVACYYNEYVSDPECTLNSENIWGKPKTLTIKIAQ